MPTDVPGLIQVVRTHPGVTAKSEIGLVSEIFQSTDWLVGPGDDGAVVAEAGPALGGGGEGRGGVGRPAPGRVGGGGGGRGMWCWFLVAGPCGAWPGVAPRGRAGSLVARVPGVPGCWAGS